MDGTYTLYIMHTTVNAKHKSTCAAHCKTTRWMVHVIFRIYKTERSRNEKTTNTLNTTNQKENHIDKASLSVVFIQFSSVDIDVPLELGKNK